MGTPQPTPRLAVLCGWIAYVVSAALVSLVVHISLQSVTALVFASLAFAVFVWNRRRTRRRALALLRQGDLTELIGAWLTAYEDNGQPAELEPLFRATALAAHGETRRARQIIGLLPDGPWQQAVEQRMIVETLLDAIDGNRERAMSVAATMSQLPLPAGRFARARAETRRAALQALARIFADRGRRDDLRWLRAARVQNPLLQLPLYYAEVVLLLQQGKLIAARHKLSFLPALPPENAFSVLRADLWRQLRGA